MSTNSTHSASQGTRSEELVEETDEDRDARIRIGGLGVLAKWVFGDAELLGRLISLLKKITNHSFAESHSEAPAKQPYSRLLFSILSNPLIWTSLHPLMKPSFMPLDPEHASLKGFGFQQPVVRKTTWSLIWAMNKWLKCTFLIPLLTFPLPANDEPAVLSTLLCQ
jgi:hypothetical protein